MFKKLIDKVVGTVNRPAAPQASGPGPISVDPKEAALLHAIAERRKSDPLVGAKLAAQEIQARLLHALKGERGVHAESLICALGALSGYACQASLRAQAQTQGLPLSTVFTIVGTKDGRKWYFGDAMNGLLAGPGLSVWGLAAVAAQDAGCTQLPDLEGIFKHSSEVLGTAAFGVPRLPEGHPVGDLPVNYVKAFWPALLPKLQSLSASPKEWPVAYGLALQRVLDMSKATLDPALALRIAMESAVPMSKVDLETA